jgi:SAM-dependent methyltransferase
MMIVLRTAAGDAVPLDSGRWHQDPTPLERRLMATMAAPVLDVGCGPGRLVVGLARQGRPALGVDPAPSAVALARRRGAPVLQRSVFDPLPGSGRWQSIILLDGNIGIGGDPVRLLERCRHLASPAGSILVEVGEPGTGCRTLSVRIEQGRRRGPWFPWAFVGSDAIGRVAEAAGLVVGRWEQGDGRWFVCLLCQEESARAVA